MIALVPKPDATLGPWIDALFASYLEDRVEAGEPRETAVANVAAQREQFFSDGRLAPGHQIFDVVDDDRNVGSVWLGPPAQGTADTSYIYYVVVNDDARGAGYGRATMLAVEQWARDHGATRIALNVFGPNVVARSLYDSLDYRVMATVMYKDIAAPSGEA